MLGYDIVYSVVREKSKEVKWKWSCLELSNWEEECWIVYRYEYCSFLRWCYIWKKKRYNELVMWVWGFKCYI